MCFEEKIIASLTNATGHLQMVVHRPELLHGGNGGDLDEIVLPFALTIVLEEPECP